MGQKLKLLAVALWVAFALAASSAHWATATTSAARQTPAPGQSAGATTAERPLTPQERRGKAIYLRGESPSGNEITAMVGELDVPASTLTCAGCHGMRGEGKTEGGVTAGNLTWANLLKPYGHTHPTGRKHGPFDEQSFARSLVEGVDPAGNEMLVAMPRFKMAAEDVADLIAYLKRIEADRDPGLTETSVKVGTILPATGALAETGAAMRDVLTAYFADVNDKGGIYNRRVELQTAETGADASATAANARRLVEDGQVFAVVSGLSAGADRELAALTQEAGVPFIGPATLLPQTGFQTNRYIFYLMPGASEQARALVNFAAGRPELKKSRLAVVHSEGELTSAAAAAVEEQARRAGWSSVVKRAYTDGRFDAAATVAALRREGAEAVFILGTKGEEASFIKEADAAGWTPHVFLLGALTGRGLAEAVPLSFKERVFLSLPTVPGDVTREGLAELRALQQKYKLAPRHTASQLMAFAAAKIFVEALKRAGRDLSRETLVTALEGLYEYDTGVTPRITFGPNRRVGAAGAYVVTFDPAKRELVAASGWVKSN
ncbi:MAG TPA: ABC transporter substrate-binding protein [Pyrinomonadaceae bacterium]|nr:ABC transporter substrate-binding protein [Pyrinomonadaceae bacterium]